MSRHAEALRALATDRRLAHAVFFKKRHPLATPEFHGSLIDDFHAMNEPKVVIEAFRGGGKSTLGEETVAIKAIFEDFANCLIVSSTQTRAAERLAAIRHEMENNDHIIDLFGEQKGDIWQANKIVLPNRVCIQVVGVGQSVRGVKHLDDRPDFVWIDDIEDEESVKTPEACQERLKWLYGTLLPVCAPHATVRVTGNRLSPYAIVTRLAESKEWKSHRYPICYFDVETGEEKATWKELRPMDWIVPAREEYFNLGLQQTWASEYMCEAISETVKPFKVEDIRVSPQVHSWHGVYSMYDPAKTTTNKRHQANTGKATWSWVGRKLVIWESWARQIMPSDLINDIFETEKKFQPVAIKVEENGLEDWLNEPLRIEQTKRRILLPNLGTERAPKDKHNFIRALQPFFLSHEIEFAQEFPDLRAEFLNFPAGRIDGLNALAYALKLRPGQLIYDAFTEENIYEEVEVTARSTPYLCVNADGTHTTAVMVQYDGDLVILADWIEDEDPGQCIEKILKRASLMGNFNVIVPPKELDQYDNKGVVAACRRIPKAVTVGSDYLRGRDELRDLFSKRGQQPFVKVSTNASWTLRALSGGYHKVFKGALDGEPEEGPYRTLMQALESFCGVMHHEEESIEGNFRTNKFGQTYRSLIGNRTQGRAMPRR